MLQGHTTAIVPCGNPTPKKLPTGGGEWPTFRTARAQRTVRPLKRPEQLQVQLVASIRGCPVYELSTKLLKRQFRL